MAWVAKDLDDYEYIFDKKPIRDSDGWLVVDDDTQRIQLPYGSIEKLIGEDLFYLDEPIDLFESLKHFI